MLTGRFQLALPAAARPTKTAFVLRFGPRTGVPGDAAAWTAGAAWMPADDVHAEIRYRDPTQMGKVYLLPAGVDREIRVAGPRTSAPKRTTRHSRWTNGGPASGATRAIVNLLKNQSFVAGIGNAYSDEILHAARLLPLRKRSSLATRRRWTSSTARCARYSRTPS